MSKGEETMPYYDDRDYLDYQNIDDLYEDDMIFEDEQEELEELRSSWEYDYHNLTEELVDE
jgi:hypothetical protein